MQTIELADGDIRIKVMPYGATLVDLRYGDPETPLVLGWQNLKDYKTHAPVYAGAVVGRYANRIAYGKAVLNGQELTFETNGPPHHVHGGSESFARQTWNVDETTDHRIILSLHSPDGHAGYPGNLDVKAIYELIDSHILRLTFEARTDKPTLLNMCHHPYFNLDGSENIAAHRLHVASDEYLPDDGTVLPTGEVRSVKGTEFDFMAPRAVHPEGTPLRYNHTYPLDQSDADPLMFAARLQGETGRTMEIWTSQPGIHVYNGSKLPTNTAALQNRPCKPHAFLCLEAQNWPDAPNNAHFPSAVLKPGETYRQVTEYRFS